MKKKNVISYTRYSKDQINAHKELIIEVGKEIWPLSVTLTIFASIFKVRIFLLIKFPINKGKFNF